MAKTTRTVAELAESSEDASSAEPEVSATSATERTVVGQKALRLRLRGWRWIAAALLVATNLSAFSRPSHADSALELLAGFDAQRLRDMVPSDEDAMTTQPVAGELAKLLYRLGRLEPSSLRSRVTPTRRVGDAVEVSGTVVAARSIPVPETLVDLLDMQRIHDFTLETDRRGPDGAEQLRLFASDLPLEISAGDRLHGVGVLIGGGDEWQQGERNGKGTMIVAAMELSWSPALAPDVGWRMLAEAGVDLAALPEVAGRDRQPLRAEDADAFYAMMAAAGQIAAGARPGGDGSLPRAEPVDPVALLRDPQQHVGRWVQIRVQTVRVTRVSLSDEPRRQASLGQDHYFQIDAMGDLGNVELQIPASDPREEPIRFVNRYPVTLVAARLPEFLAAELARTSGSDAVVASVSVPVEVSGFFFRVWRYESDFMAQRGGGQLAPLVIAARMEDRRLPEDPVGVARIGWWAAGGVVIGIALIVLWTWVTGRRDARARRRRRERESEQARWPTT